MMYLSFVPCFRLRTQYHLRLCLTRIFSMSIKCIRPRTTSTSHQNNHCISERISPRCLIFLLRKVLLFRSRRFFFLFFFFLLSFFPWTHQLHVQNARYPCSPNFDSMVFQTCVRNRVALNHLRRLALTRFFRLNSIKIDQIHPSNFSTLSFPPGRTSSISRMRRILVQF